MSDFVWRRKDIDARREVMGERISAAMRQHSSSTPARAILGLLVENRAERDQHFDLDRFILALRCLMEHRKSGELRQHEVTRLVDLCRVILLSSGVKPQSTRLNYLYENLFLVVSQIEWNNSNIWESAWNQAMSRYFAEPTDEKEPAHQVQATALRMFRLGFGDAAIESLDYALSKFDGKSLERVHILVLKARLLRMQGEELKFSEFVAANSREFVDFPDLRTEIDWEIFVQATLVNRDFASMAKSVAKGKRFYQTSYILEAFLLLRCFAERPAILKLENLQTIENRRDMSLKQGGILYQAVIAIEKCYDLELPVSTRLVELGSVITNRHRAKTRYEEMLILAAACTWLRRVRLTEFYNLCLEEYRVICLRLTSGRSNDIFRIVPDKETDEHVVEGLAAS